MPLPDILYRYTELQWGIPFVEEGIVSFGAAAGYDDSLLNDAQKDNEQRREFNLRMDNYTMAVGQLGQPQAHGLANLTKIKVGYDLKSKGEFLRYHILCLSNTADPIFYERFDNSDCMITINNPEEFWKRMCKAIDEQLPGYGICGDDVTYFDPKELMKIESILDCCFLKNKNDFEWQTEYRVALFSPPDKATSERICLGIGDLRDICSLTNK